MPAILYSLVSREQNVLAEFTEAGLQGNFPAITRVLLKKIPKEDGKLSYIYDNYVFHYAVSGGLTFLCMCDNEMAKLAAFRFLGRIESEFLRLYSGRWTTATAYQYNADFKGVLESYARESSAYKDEKIENIKSQISDIREVMSMNIDKVLERGERIEILVDKSQQMEQNAFRFHKKARKLKRTFCFNNYKWCLLIIFVLLAITYLILAFACHGPKLPKCT